METATSTEMTLSERWFEEATKLASQQETSEQCFWYVNECRREIASGRVGMKDICEMGAIMAAMYDRGMQLQDEERIRAAAAE